MEKAQKPYIFIDHTADIGIEVREKNLSALLEQAAEALFCVITDISTVRPSICVQISAYQGEGEEMMRHWLEELLYRFYQDDMVFSRFKVDASGDDLVGEAWGEAIDPDRHLVHTEIKGITYHQFEVSQSETGWYARIIFDV